MQVGPGGKDVQEEIKSQIGTQVIVFTSLNEIW